MDLDWGNIPNIEEENQKMISDCEMALNDEPEADYDMVVRKSWAEYAKDINRLRAQLRYMKKTVGYCRYDDTSPHNNQIEIIEVQKEIKRLCKLRDAAKSMEKANKYAKEQKPCDGQVQSCIKQGYIEAGFQILSDMKNDDRKNYPKEFLVKYSTKDISEPKFVKVISVRRDAETNEFILETIFEDIRLPGDMDTEIVIGGD